MSRALFLILVLAATTAAPRLAATETETTPRLAIALLTRELLAEATAVAEAARIATARRDGTCLDARSGLVWTRTDNAFDIDWYGAESYCATLATGGWQDWRLPTIEELEQLHQPRSLAYYKLPAAFSLTGCCPWSSTASVEGSALNYSFLHREIFSGNRNYSFGLRALCVRIPAPADVEFFFDAASKALAEKKPYPWLLGVKRRRLRS